MNARFGSWIKGVAILIAGIAIGIGMPGAQPTTAKEVKKVEPPRIGYVNIVQVVREYEKGRIQTERPSALRAEYANRIAVDRDELKKINELYFAKTMTPEAKKELQERALILHRKVEAAEAEAKTKTKELSDRIIVEVFKQLQAVIREMAENRNLDVVEAFPGQRFPSRDIHPDEAGLMLQTPALMPFYLKPELDFTQEVIDRLNKKHPPEKE